MIKFSRIWLLLSVVILAGCAASPIVGGDSKLERRVAVYPKTGLLTHVAQGGLIHLKADYSSRFTFRLNEPVSTGLALGKIVIGTDEPLIEAQLDGVRVYCTNGRTYIDPLTGPHKRSCLIEGEKGRFNQVRAAPGAVWFTKNISPPVPFQSVEIPVSLNGQPLKRELVFEGVQNGRIFLTERVYEGSLESASRARPLQARFDSLPATITVSGVSLKIVSASDTSLTFELLKEWD